MRYNAATTRRRRRATWLLSAALCAPIFVIMNLLYAVLFGNLTTKLLWKLLTGRDYSMNRKQLVSFLTVHRVVYAMLVKIGQILGS